MDIEITFFTFSYCSLIDTIINLNLLILLPWESHGGRSLVGYRPWGRKELDTTDWLHFTSSYLIFINILSIFYTFCILFSKSCSEECPVEPRSDFLSTEWWPNKCLLFSATSFGITFHATKANWCRWSLLFFFTSLVLNWIQ